MSEVRLIFRSSCDCAALAQIKSNSKISSLRPRSLPPSIEPGRAHDSLLDGAAASSRPFGLPGTACGRGRHLLAVASQASADYASR
jgi:hypothetical protein